MSGEKRKAAGDWIEATILNDKESRGSYLASFSGITPPVTTTFREYKRKRTDATQPIKDVILQGETERIEFEGRTTNEGNDDHCQYAIVIYNETKGTLKLLPTPMIHMQQSIKALKSKGSKDALETPIREQRSALGSEFGSKRAKAAIASQLSNQVDTEALETVASQIFENVKYATENIPSHDVLAEELNADRPIPAIDLTATTPAGLYSLDAIVSNSEISMIDVEAIYALPDEAARLAAIPYKNSKFINDRLKRLFKQEEPDHVRLRMLFYASLLMAFFKNHRMASKTAALKSALGPVPGPLFQGLLTRYTEDQLTSSKEDAKKRSVCTSKCQDKVVCYLFVLCLMLDEFTVDINLLAHDIQIKPTKATELFKTIGCKIVALSEAEREARKITKSEAKSFKLAKLACPPQFPRARRPAAKNNRGR